MILRNIYGQPFQVEVGSVLCTGDTRYIVTRIRNANSIEILILDKRRPGYDSENVSSGFTGFVNVQNLYDLEKDSQFDFNEILKKLEIPENVSNIYQNRLTIEQLNKDDFEIDTDEFIRHFQQLLLMTEYYEKIINFMKQPVQTESKNTPINVEKVVPVPNRPAMKKQITDKTKKDGKSDNGKPNIRIHEGSIGIVPDVYQESPNIIREESSVSYTTEYFKNASSNFITLSDPT